MRVFIAEHELKVRSALRALLLRRPGIEVVGEATTVDELRAQLEPTRPELLLLHWRLGDGMPKLLATLKRACPELEVIVLSVRQEACREALAAGAGAFVCKMDPPDKLLAAIEVAQARHAQDRDEQCAQQGQRSDTARSQSVVQDPRQLGRRLKTLGLKGPNPKPVPQPGE
jgi:DNA-binding NarL/FixJ family response regulator